MERLPKLIASSVVRGSQQGDSHGGVYLVDIDRGAVECKVDWNRTDIDTSGRGGDRGLRGIDFLGDKILIAANAQIWIFDPDFRCLESLSNRYLSHCHEISVHDSRLFLSSTGYDSILVLDLRRKRFTHGFHLSFEANRLRLRRYDPQSRAGPEPSRRFHINSVKCTASGIYFSGLYTPGLLRTDGRGLHLVGRLPEGTHNAQLTNSGLLYNDTASDCICYRANGATINMSVPHFSRGDLLNIDRYESSVARARFARGLAAISPRLIAGGSSPSTVAIYDLANGTRVATQNISMDVRNAIHGLAVWPF